MVAYILLAGHSILVLLLLVILLNGTPSVSVMVAHTLGSFVLMLGVILLLVLTLSGCTP
jgi:hypothetical protein